MRVCVVAYAAVLGTQLRHGSGDSECLAWLLASFPQCEYGARPVNEWASVYLRMDIVP